MAVVSDLLLCGGGRVTKKVWKKRSRTRDLDIGFGLGDGVLERVCDPYTGKG